MSIWRQLTGGLRGLLHRSTRNQQIGDEVRQYFEEATAAYIERGYSEEDARRAARREFGNPAAVEDQARSYGWENMVRTILGDLRFAARQLLKNPGFTIVCAITLALGIGASTAIFSAVDPILFKPLPYPHPGRIVMIWNTWQNARSEIAFGTYREIAERSHSFESTAIFEPWQPAMTGGTEPERIEGQKVSTGFFRVLGVAPVLGRDFLNSEEGPRGAKVAILSDKLWRHLFHADPAILGRPIQLDGDSYSIIGVMPREFENVLAPTAELWTPDQYDSSQITHEFNSWAWGNHLRMVGRVRSGVTYTMTVQELEQIARAPWPQYPRPRWAALNHGLIVDSLQDDIAHTVKPALLAVLSAVILVLAIACVNVINLVLARTGQRIGEFAARSALGASRARLVRQLVTESLLLAFLGGALGIAAAVAGIRAIVALSPAELPRLNAIAFDSGAFFFAFGITSLIGLAAGVIPALHISRDNLQPRLQQYSRRVSGSHLGTRRLLVVTEVALALILLVSAGLLLRSMQRLLRVNPGFDASHLLTMQVLTSGHKFDNSASDPEIGDRARRRFFEEALDAVRNVPGVQQAEFTSFLPLSDDLPVNGVYGAQFEDQDPQSGFNVFRYAISPGYCHVMGIPLISGRLLGEHDVAGAPQSVLISQSLARRHFGNRNPIGSRLHVGPRNRPWYTVVGVVGNVKQTSLAMQQEDAVYLSTEQTWYADDTLSLVVRSQGSSAALVPAIKAAIWSVDKNQPIVRVTTMDRLMAQTEAEQRFVLILFEAFGLVALSLAAVGLYGVLSGSVAQRTHEIGIRIALGASRWDVLEMTLRDGMQLTAFGIAIGLCGAFAASQAISSLLFSVSALDAVSWIGMIALLVAVATVSSWVPAWRAARVDPCITLRAE